MPHHNITDDIKAMAREIRATGIAVAKQANQLQLLGKTLEAEALSEAAQEMSSAAERLEAWRLHKADALRGLATWLDPESAAQELREIAQQLDPCGLDGADHAEPTTRSAKAQALDALKQLDKSLPATPETEQVSNVLNEAMDAIDGYGKWPEPSDLSDEFKAQIAIWHHKGNLRGGIDLTEESTGEIHVTVADYAHMETLYSGGLYATWAAAYAAIGVALDARKSPA